MMAVFIGAAIVVRELEEVLRVMHNVEQYEKSDVAMVLMFSIVETSVNDEDFQKKWQQSYNESLKFVIKAGVPAVAGGVCNDWTHPSHFRLLLVQ